jgi:hypothetical protein
MSRGNSTTGSVSRSGFLSRRVRSAVAATGFVVAVVLATRWLDSRLGHGSWLSGQVLAGVVLFLAAFRARKLFPGVSWLGTASFWMQLHAWCGIAALVLFGLHVGWSWPNGVFERCLALSFLLTGASGVYGLVITRLLPRRLASLAQQAAFEQIPRLRAELAAKSWQIAGPGSGTTLARHYVNHVAAFFQLPRSLAFQLAPSARQCKRIVAGIRALDRYLTEPERAASRELMQIVREKDDLDYHRAIQGRLKWWLVGHLALTAVLLVLAGLHVAIVVAFAGGRG